MYTAGHCFAEGETAYQGFYYEPEKAFYYTEIIGPASRRQWANGLLDAELVRTNRFGERQWHGPVNTLTHYFQFVNDSNHNGLQVCSNGSFGGLKCFGTVESTDACVNWGQVTSCHLTIARPNNGQAMSIPGDSGGPVILTTISTGAEAVGIINGNTDESVPRLAYSSMRNVCAAIGDRCHG
jgi:hypothetical protein